MICLEGGHLSPGSKAHFEGTEMVLRASIRSGRGDGTPLLMDMGTPIYCSARGGVCVCVCVCREGSAEMIYKLNIRIPVPEEDNVLQTLGIFAAEAVSVKWPGSSLRGARPLFHQLLWAASTATG